MHTRIPAVRYYNFAPGSASMHERILRGLRGSEKELPSFLLYDARGIRLFNQLCRLGGHSIVRRECRLLRGAGDELRRLLGKRTAIVEYGSGTSQTATALLRGMSGVAAYLPVDLSLSSLRFGVRRLRMALKRLSIVPVRADFTSCFPMPAVGLRPERTLVYLSSCALSTMDVAEASRLLQGAAKLCGQRGAVLLGVDLRADPLTEPRSGALLEAFNLNILTHINRRFAANFHVRRFEHAVIDESARNRMELRLTSRVDQIVKIDQERVRLRRGDSILTESRQRYTWNEVERLAHDSAETIERTWFDGQGTAALVLLRPKL
ncbi:MAG TPA: L-histidine N(alpha)-methyltransferase [Pirellulales bacterium]|nr:L-histidine N(alpha)-methyltransferase [Pirellulales bacterium]